MRTSGGGSAHAPRWAPVCHGSAGALRDVRTATSLPVSDTSPPHRVPFAH